MKLKIRQLLTTGTPDGTKFLRDDGAWADPGGGGGGGGGDLAAAVYNPGTGAALNTSSSSFADVHASLSCTFDAPASGEVWVMLQAMVAWAGVTSDYWWNLRDSGGNVAGTSNAVAYVVNDFYIAVTRHIRVTGLTPGNSYTWKWGHRTSGTAGIQAGTFGTDDSRPAVMRVTAA